MSWLEGERRYRRLARIAGALAIAGLVAGCFQPLYGNFSVGNEPVLRERMQNVDVLPIEAPPASTEARIGVDVRNALLFDLTGGERPPTATHSLKILLRASRLSVIVDLTTARPDVENFGIDATYQLYEI